MATFHNFDFKIKSVKQQGLFSPMMGVCINVIDGCMYIFMLYFSRHKVLTFEPQKLAIFELQLCPIDHKI